MDRAARILVHLLLVTAGLCIWATASAVEEPPPEELYRFRVTNSAGGNVEVSLDAGKSYVTVGRVTKPATSTAAGFAAAGYAPNSSVAATAIHGIRIKVAQVTTKSRSNPVTISLVPSEFARIPKGYGGHAPGSSGIYTDIPSGTAIFRTFSPFAGSRVYLQRKDGKQTALSPGYVPAKGDRLIVVVERPARWPSWLEFENREGGAVTAVYTDGSQEQITAVISPVMGVGRYDGCSYTGVGCINTNHAGVLTISTSPISASPLPEGDGPERRGGFMIQPSYHAGTQGDRVPQVMVVGPEKPPKPVLEGKPPLFLGHLGLSYDASDVENSYRAQVRIDGADWEDMPAFTGKVDNAFSPAQLTAYFERLGRERRIETGITHIRVMFPRLNREYLATQAEKLKRTYSSPVKDAGGRPVVTGTLTINAVTKDSVVRGFLTVYIDDKLVAMTNSAKCSYDWDTTQVEDGEHTIELRGSDESGNIISSKITKVTVKNGKPAEQQ